MYRYEVSYRENGILKNKGFKYKEQFEKFIAKLMKSNKYTNVRIADNTIPNFGIVTIK